jgi:eukaryotic-like serine/threonine-protein kinase
MPLGPGTRLDAYEIVRPLGSGGMGEVWLATEVRLGRKVALKVLPADFTRDASRVLRFEQEARAASGLSHPNVCTIHALGETAEGLRYIAMEYVEGETLRERLATMRFSIRAALDIAIQVAAALSAAHASGIVHRDIKPENVMRRPDGFVKVLDFGLAKLAPSPAEIAGADSTRLALKTEAGVVVGTAAYMSPEQARGQEVDARTDIWSLGVLLYEMVAGRSPFAAPSGTEVLAAILDRDPAPLARFEPDTPAELQRIITKCLRKERALRYQVVQDLLLDLQALRDELPAQARSGSGPVAQPLTAPVHGTGRDSGVAARTRRRFALGATIVVLIAAAALGAWWGRTKSVIGSSGAAAHVERALTRLTFAPGLQTDVTFSPDGRYIAYASDQAGNFDIWVQPLAGGDPVQVTKSPAADTEPDWSPDGAQIVFRSERDGGGLFVVSAFGGPERRLTPFGIRPKWSPDGSRVLFASERGWGQRVALFVVGSDGAPPQRVFDRFIDPDKLLGWAWHPDGRRVTLLGERRERPERTLLTVPLDGHSSIATTVPPALRAGGEGNRYGEFVWASAGTAIYFELRSNFISNLWRLDVDPVTLESGALTRLTAGAGQDSRLAISPDGTKLAFTTRAEAIRVWAYSLDPATGRVVGSAQPVTDPTTAVPATAFLSPDGRQLAYSITGVGTGRWELWKADLATAHHSLLGRDSYSRFDPKWSSDGTRLVYQWGRGVSANEFEMALAVRRASGGDEALVSTPARHLVQPHDWSPDGKSILVTVLRLGERATLALWPLAAAPRAETAAAVVAADPNHDLWQGRFSSDGRWISFLAVKGGADAQAVLCVIPSTARQTAAADWTCLTDPGVWTDKPRWSSDGKLLYVWRRNGSLFNVWAQRFDDAQGRTVGLPFQVTQFESPAHRIWDDEIGLSEPSVAGNRMTLPIAEATGSVWILDNVDR